MRAFLALAAALPNHDSHARLVAEGVIPRRQRHPAQRPNPFPGGFVPDPWR